MDGRVPSGVSVATNLREPLNESNPVLAGQDRCHVLECGDRTLDWSSTHVRAYRGAC